jgi:hypothetical protein
VRIAAPGGAPNGSVFATIERVSRLGWVARLTLRLADDNVLVAHVPQEELNGAHEGDTVSVDLRNPKAFHREGAEGVEESAIPA